MKKALKIIFVLNLLLIVFIITFPKFVNQKTDTARKVGEKWSGGALTVNEYYNIERCFEVYLKHLQNGEYEEAFEFISAPYRLKYTLSEFAEQMGQYTWSTYHVKEITPLTQNMYLVTLEVDGIEVSNLFFASEKALSISPDLLMEYHKKSDSFKKNQTLFEVVSTENYVNEFVINLKVTNQHAKKTVKIVGSRLDVDGVINKEGKTESILLLPKEEKILSIHFDTDIDFPSAVEMIYEIQGKQKTLEITL